MAESALKEGRQLDFKEQFDPASALEWANIVKDIVAMANSGGGALIFGVTDEGVIAKFDKSVLLDMDPATIADKVFSYTGENFLEFEVVEIKRDNSSLAAILIFETESPVVFIRNGADASFKGRQKPTFLKGTLYFRHGAKSEPADSADIRRAIEKILARTRKNWLQSVRKISSMDASDEIIIKKKNPALQGEPLTLARALRVSEKGTPVTLSHVEFEALRQEYPLEYKDVLNACKKKKVVPQRKLQKYIDSCKGNQDLSINWREVGKSLSLPFPVQDKHMYKQKVVDDF